MAQANIINYEDWKLLIGDGGSPEAFTAPCALTARDLGLSSETNSSNIPDCTDETLPSWPEKRVVSLSTSVSGSGVVHRADQAMWRNWLLFGTVKTIRMFQVGTAAQFGGYYQGGAILTSLNMTGEEKDTIKFDVSIESSGKWTWTDAV